MLDKFLNKDKDGNEYLTIYYQYPTNNYEKTITLNVYTNHFIIPKGTEVYRANDKNRNFVKEEIYEYKDERRHEYIKKYYYYFEEDFKVPTIKEFYKAIGDNNPDHRRFTRKARESICYDYTYYTNKLVLVLLKNDLPIIYHNIINSFCRSHLCPFVLEYFLDENSEIAKERVNMEDIQKFIDFYEKWMGKQSFSHWNFIDDLKKDNSLYSKIDILYKDKIIIKRHKYKLQRLLKNNEQFALDIVNLVIKDSYVSNIKIIYDMIENEDVDFYINNKSNKDCIIL